MVQALGVIGQTNFTVLDWVIVAVYLAGTVAIGLYVKKYIANMADYVVAGRGVRTALGVATLTGTEMGLITVMYSAQKGFTRGFSAFHIAAAAGVVALLVGLTGFIVCKLREMKVLTIPEFYGRRFGRKTRILGGFMLVFGGVLNMGLFLKIGSMFVVGITGMEHGTALAAIMIVLLVLVLLFAFASPALAQDGGPVATPTGKTVVDGETGEVVEEESDTWANAWEFVKNFGMFLIVTVIAIITTERTTELGKMLTRWFAKTKLTQWLYVHGTGSVAIAVLVAFVGIYQFDVQLLERFATLQEAVDPELLRIVSGVIVWVASTLFHGELPDNLKIARKVGKYGEAPKKKAAPTQPVR